MCGNCNRHFDMSSFYKLYCFTSPINHLILFALQSINCRQQTCNFYAKCNLSEIHLIQNHHLMVKNAPLEQKGSGNGKIWGVCTVYFIYPKITVRHFQFKCLLLLCLARNVNNQWITAYFKQTIFGHQSSYRELWTTIYNGGYVMVWAMSGSVLEFHSFLWWDDDLAICYHCHLQPTSNEWMEKGPT